jgi:excisionase family DNA binding protein
MTSYHTGLTMLITPPDRLLTVNEVADFLRIAKTTVRKWDREHILPSVRLGDRSDRRYRRSDVLALLKEEL